MRIARHYAAARAVPEANIIALPMPTEETIAWREFVPLIWDPLLELLVREEWVDAIPMDLVDLVGRRRYVANSHRIAALVVCRGVPLRIAHDPALYEPTLPFTTRGELRTNAGAVDGELALLAMPDHAINAFVPNPLFQNERPRFFDEQQIVKVSRLDGPTAADAMALVDRAIVAERQGLFGRAYVDLSHRDPVGDGWLEATANQLEALGFETVVDRESATFPAGARMDAPVFYFGWYAENLDGPFALPGFQFPPGAIAFHMHSFSATTLRSTSAGWAGPLVARGVTATFGNVDEPYMLGMHRPNLVLRALSRGANLVDAAYFGLQALSWQEVLIGDPLYRPFGPATDAGSRVAVPSGLEPYAVLRNCRTLERAGRGADALSLLRTAQATAPSLPVGVELAKRLRAAGDVKGVESALGFVRTVDKLPTDQWALAFEAAQLLADSGGARVAVPILALVLSQKSMPRDVRVLWLRQAAAIASSAGDRGKASAWTREADELSR